MREAQGTEVCNAEKAFGSTLNIELRGGGKQPYVEPLKGDSSKRASPSGWVR
jgi:hypothetical protein